MGLVAAKVNITEGMLVMAAPLLIFTPARGSVELMPQVPDWTCSVLPKASIAKYLMVVVAATGIGLVYLADAAVGEEPSVV